MKILIAILAFVAATLNVTAAYELSVEVFFPRHLLLTIPANEESDFEMHSSFCDGDYFTITGRLIRTANTNNVNIKCSYKYKLGNSTGTANNMAINGPYGTAIPSGPNKMPRIETVPMFTVLKPDNAYTQPPPTNTWVLEAPETK